MKHVKRVLRTSETQWLLFFSVALLLISPFETSDERALVKASTSIENVFVAISDIRN